MIVVELICEQEHRFEGWFASAEDMAGQQHDGLLACPLCNSRKVERAAPETTSPRRTDIGVEAAQQAAEAQQLLHMLMQKLQSEALLTEDASSEPLKFDLHRLHFSDADEHAIRSVASLMNMESLFEELANPEPIAKEDLH